MPRDINFTYEDFDCDDPNEPVKEAAEDDELPEPDLPREKSQGHTC